MALRFNKRIKIFPGVKLNISKSGVSTTIGGKGASVNIGKKGTHVNQSIPGTGLSSRTKVSRQTNSVKDGPSKSVDSSTRSVYTAYFPDEYADELHEVFADCDRTTFESFARKNRLRDPTLVTFIAIVFGGIGADRFYLGEPWLGVLKLLSIGGAGLWWLYDIVTASKRTRYYNTQRLNEEA